MTPRPLDRLLRQVAGTETDEISCSECFDLLASGVEQELAGMMPSRLAQHLMQCGVCREEYEVLRDLVRSAPGDPPHAGPAAPSPGPAR